jgi:hypothetical protein
MTYCEINGDRDNDEDSLVLILEHLGDAWIAFDDDPDIDSTAEVASWARTTMTFGASLEDAYGVAATKSMFQRAWRKVRE